MKTTRLFVACLLLLALGAFSGCTSTRTDNGVTIEKKRSDLPFVPFF